MVLVGEVVCVDVKYVFFLKGLDIGNKFFIGLLKGDWLCGFCSVGGCCKEIRSWFI